ncbi:MAG: tRNA uridine-5-carboxymethylaminomethyl(34) synthesis GTPase MnmE [Verrucomicrobiota bacterium]
MDTIAAVSTAPGQGAVALVRVSGAGALGVASRVFRRAKGGAEGLGNLEGVEPRRAVFGGVWDGERKLDEVLLTYFCGPKSFTGEDVVEIACHGGTLLTRRILELVLRSGARLAEPGEFTQRAFLNGKLDLTQAEAVMDLIGAQSDLALRAAGEQLEGRLGEAIGAMREELLEVLAHVEAYIDFPEEDIAPDTGRALRGRLEGVGVRLERLLGTAQQGRVLREGARTVIYGAPNVGKSSLLNRFLGFERAIVSAQPGTTRDTLEEVVMLRGWPIRLVDTAGVRDTGDGVEAAGIGRTRRELERADLVLAVVDGSAPREGALLPEGVGLDGRVVLILNKADLGEHPSWEGVSGVRFSCVSGAGQEALDGEVEARLSLGLGGTGEWRVAINARHQDCLRRALERLQAGLDAFGAGLSAEFVAEELRGALEAVGEVVGRADTEELLGKIFATFCIGK